jgi:hypothetical protein
MQMIDTTRFDIPLLNAQQVVDAYVAKNPKCKGRRWFRAVIPGQYGEKAHVRPIRGGTRLLIEVSVPKFLFGHNVFGFNDLQAQLRLVLEHIAGALEIPWNIDGMLKDGNLHRIDQVANLKLVRGTTPEAALRGLRGVLEGEGRAVKAIVEHGYVNSIYLNPSDKFCSLKWYNKFVELNRHPIHQDVEGREDIKAWAGTVLRFEVSLRGKEVGVSRVAEWTAAGAKKALFERLDAIDLKGSGLIAVDDEILGSLSPKLQAIIRVHSRGIPPREIFERRTVRRAQAAILEKAKYDIYADPKSECGMDLRQLIADPKRRRAGRPRWARKAFGPLPSQMKKNGR